MSKADYLALSRMYIQHAVDLAHAATIAEPDQAPIHTERDPALVLGCDGHPLPKHFRNVTTTNQKGAYEKF